MTAASDDWAATLRKLEEREPVEVVRVHYDRDGKEIPAHQLPSGRVGRRRKYPWDAWKDGEWHVLTRGEDFDIPLENFRNSVYMHATRCDMQVMTEIVSREDGTLAICFIDEAPRGQGRHKPVKKAGPASDYEVI